MSPTEKCGHDAVVTVNNSVIEGVDPIKSGARLEKGISCDFAPTAIVWQDAARILFLAYHKAGACDHK